MSLLAEFLGRHTPATATSYRRALDEAARVMETPLEDPRRRTWPAT
jgi:hypothetical protein